MSNSIGSALDHQPTTQTLLNTQWELLRNMVDSVPGASSAIGYYAKAVEIIFLAFLWADKQQPAPRTYA